MISGPYQSLILDLLSTVPLRIWSVDELAARIYRNRSDGGPDDAHERVRHAIMRTRATLAREGLPVRISTVARRGWILERHFEPDLLR